MSEGWRKLIKLKLAQLTKSTVIGPEFATSLLEKELIDDDEFHLLLDSSRSDVLKAAKLYSSISTKWTDKGFGEFKGILDETGNKKAFQILNETPSGELLVSAGGDTQNQIELLRQHREKEVDGRYEGINLEEEEKANTIVEIARRSAVLHSGEVQLGVNDKWHEIVCLLKRFEVALTKKQVWWNPSKPQLPTNFIHRRISRSNKFELDGSLVTDAETKTMLEVNEKFVLLVDPPGMGKTTEMSHLEQTLRSHYLENRVIIRVNLNAVQDILSDISNLTDATAAVKKIACFVPSKTLKIPHIRVFLLIDGLDEVFPTYKETMIKLLRTFKDSKEPNNLHVVVTMRPYLREALEDEFEVESWSLLQLSTQEQNSYIQKGLDYSTEQTQEIRNKLPQSVSNMLGNPLMLSILVDIIKLEGTSFSAENLNIYDLYNRFVDAKHKLLLVEKKKMQEKDNYTQMQAESMLSTNLKFYFHIAWNELLRANAGDSERNILPTFFTESIGNIAVEPPSGIIVAELFTYGLLLERGDAKTLVFKHRSFAEFFYAHLLLCLDCPQEVRDTLFGFIYAQDEVFGNVEVFVGAALSKEGFELQLTTKWILIVTDQYNLRSRMLVNYARGNLFRLLNRQVLMTFLNGDYNDKFHAFFALALKTSREALLEWMCENREWSRRVLLDMNNQPAMRLAVAIGMAFENQQLFTANELAEILESLEDVISIVATTHSENKNKWDILGESKFRELIKNSDSGELINLTFDMPASWKLLTTFSPDEIYDLVSNEEKRITDLLGFSPPRVLIALGEDYIPTHNHLTKFRGKFEEDVGKSIFEFGWWDLALKMLWSDLEKEAEEKKSSGGDVTIALREAIGRKPALDLLMKSEAEIRMRRRCPWDTSQAAVIEWVADGGHLWDSLTEFSLNLLPYVLRYSGSADNVKKILGHNKQKVEDKVSWMCLLKSLVISSHTEHFIQIRDFLTMQLKSSPSEFKPLIKILLATDKEDLAKQLQPSFLVTDVSVGQVFLLLMKDWMPLLKPFVIFSSTEHFPQIREFLTMQLKSSSSDIKSLIQVFVSAEKEEMERKRKNSLVPEVSLGQVLLELMKGKLPVEVPWVDIVSDVCQFTRCCDLYATLQNLAKLPLNKLRGFLLNGDVLFQWQQRFTSRNGRKVWEASCGLRSLLTFYFDVFGLNLDWVEEGGDSVGVHLLRRLPVEVVTTLEQNPLWAGLVQHFKDFVRKHFHSNKITSINQVASDLNYETEEEWERLLEMLGDEAIHPGIQTNTHIPSGFSAPLIHVLIRRYGVQETKRRVSTLWEHVPSSLIFVVDSIQTKASLLHCAIQLGELEEVVTSTFPGLLPWRNPQGKNALDVATEHWEITIKSPSI